MSFRLKALTLVVLLGMAGGIENVSAQQLAVKTNLLYDATTTPNIGVELGVGKKHSMQLYYGLNPWKFNTDNGKKFFKHWMLAPEYRYWFCHRFQGSFVGVHGLGGEFNAANVKLPFGMYKGLRDHRYEGWYIGGGVSYGYQWVLSRASPVVSAAGRSMTVTHGMSVRRRQCFRYFICSRESRESRESRISREPR